MSSEVVVVLLVVAAVLAAEVVVVVTTVSVPDVLLLLPTATNPFFERIEVEKAFVEAVLPFAENSWIDP